MSEFFLETHFERNYRPAPKMFVKHFTSLLFLAKASTSLPLNLHPSSHCAHCLTSTRWRFHEVSRAVLQRPFQWTVYFAYICMTRSDWPPEPSLPERVEHLSCPELRQQTGGRREERSPLPLYPYPPWKALAPGAGLMPAADVGRCNLGHPQTRG